MAQLNVMMENHERKILAKARRVMRRAAYYSRSTMKFIQRPGKTRRMPVESRVMGNAGKFVDTVRFREVRSRSKIGRPPHYHVRGGKFGLKTIWAQPFAGTGKLVWEIGPLVGKTKGSKKTTAKIHEIVEKGGPARILMHVNNTYQNTNQRFNRALQPQESWVGARYGKRPYASPALLPTLKKFKSVWGTTRL